MVKNYIFYIAASIFKWRRLTISFNSKDMVLDDPPPQAFLMGFGDNGVNLELRVWIDDADSRGIVRSELYKRIWKDFHAAGISFPFPQRDVYIKEFRGEELSPPRATPGSRGESARGRKRATKEKSPD